MRSSSTSRADRSSTPTHVVSELRNNRIRGAALDVTDPEPLPEDHPLWGLGNVTITPHNAGHTPHYYERVADILAENVGRLDDGDDLKTGSCERTAGGVVITYK